MDSPPAWIGWSVAAAVGVAWGFIKNVLEIRTKLAGTRLGKWVVMFATEGKRIRILEEKVAALTPVVVPPEIAAWNASLAKMRDYRMESTRLLDLAASRTASEVHSWFVTSQKLTAAIAKLLSDDVLPLNVLTRYEQPHARPTRLAPEHFVRSPDAAVFTGEFHRLQQMEVALVEAEPVLAQAIEQRTPAKKK